MAPSNLIREFHVSSASRRKYQFDEALFTLSGNVIFANYHAARLFAHKINGKRDLISFPEQAVMAGDLYAMGLIDEILHYMISVYIETVNPRLMDEALVFSGSALGQEALHDLLHRFVNEFPPLHVFQGKMTADQYMADPEHRTLLLEEMLMLWLANINPAFSPFSELFDDRGLEAGGTYQRLIEHLTRFFEAQSAFGPDGQNLIEMLKSPAKASPHSLSGQLDYIRSRWGVLINDRYLYRLLGSLDFMREESKFRGTGSGQSVPPDFSFGVEEAERFSPGLYRLDARCGDDREKRLRMAGSAYKTDRQVADPSGSYSGFGSG